MSLWYAGYRRRPVSPAVSIVVHALVGCVQIVAPLVAVLAFLG